MEVSMKKVVYVLLGLTLSIVLVAGTACTSGGTPSGGNTGTTQNITGTVTGNPVTAPTTAGGNETITITTPSGPQIFPVSPNASTTFAGQACTIDQLNQYVADNTTYNCSIVYTDQLGVIAINVAGAGNITPGIIPPGVTP